MTHTIVPELLNRQVNISLVGAGGNGSQMLTGLARLNLAMRSLGHPYGLHVTVYDPDKVSTANVGRQLFSPSDVGQYKAVVLTHRLNAYYCLNWEACPVRFNKHSSRFGDLLISCVDTGQARREIHTAIWDKAGHTPRYWLDLGNRQQDGQVILGQPRATEWTPEADRVAQKGKRRPAGSRSIGNSLYIPNRLPCVTEVFESLWDETLDAEDADTPSCSLAEALSRQGLFVNDHVSRWALTLLERLFREGRLSHHGYFVNLTDGKVNPMPVPETRP